MRAIIGILIGLGLIVLVLVLIFAGGGQAPKQLYLPDYATSQSFVELTETGPITAPQNHYGVRIRVSGDETTYEAMQGYEDQTISQKSYPMTMAAYTDFLFALQRENFTQGNPDPALKENRGYCPFGRLYEFAFNDGTNEVERYWKTSCGDGNFNGNGAAIRDLFRAQVPGYSDLTGSLSGL